MKVIRHEDRLWVSVEDHQKAVEFARIAAAIVEREECADIAALYDLGTPEGHEIAAVIRARGKK